MKKGLIIVLVILLLVGGYYIWNSTDTTIKKEKKQTIKLIDDKDIEKSIFKDYYKEARILVSKMSLEEKIGQLFLVRYDKNEVNNWKKYYPGGYILFAKDFENHTKSSIKKELDNNQKNSKYPLIIAVDEEGGYVTRVSRFPTLYSEKFASPKYYYETGGYELLEKMENEKAQLLTSLGINLNLAPVADISTDENDFIYSRSFGHNKEETSEFIKNMVKYANNNHISSCLKHFPGYGNNKDTHTGIAIDNRSYESFLKNDFLPFKAGIEEGVPSILVSHNIVTSIDDKYPSSLSNKVINELRNTLNFTGIILTDDLAMDAVASYVENNEAATLAINAGNDMIITSDFISMYNEILNSVKNNKIKEEVINKAVLRIIAWKYQQGIFNTQGE